jgi:hypothetical protein
LNPQRNCLKALRTRDPYPSMSTMRRPSMQRWKRWIWQLV